MLSLRASWDLWRGTFCHLTFIDFRLLSFNLVEIKRECQKYDFRIEWKFLIELIGCQFTFRNSFLSFLFRYYNSYKIGDQNKISEANLKSPENKQSAIKKASNFVELLKSEPKNLKMFDLAEKIVNELGLIQKSENMEFYVIALAFPTQTLKMLKEIKSKSKLTINMVKQGISIVKLIDGALNRFSKKVFKTFMEIPEISFMVQHYLASNADHLSKIEGFETCIKIIKDKSNEVIGSFA